MYRLKAFLLCLLILGAEAHAQSEEAGHASHVGQEAPFTPNLLPSLTLQPVSTEMRIDGELDETAWRSAARAANFSETFPGDQTKPPIDITGMMMYDDENLYVAFVMEDDPAAIRANLSDRDAIWQDDYVGILLDPNRDGQALYFLAANPMGIQGDTRISPNNEDEGFNLIFYSEGKITETGYQVEMAIPFKSLRFPNKDVQTWGATFWITRPRASRNTYSWAAIDRDNPCWSCQLGAINGISGIRAGKNLEVLPALTGAGAGALRDGADPTSGFDGGKIKLEPSLNLKYGITSEMTTDLTVNPDFSQIESDVAQVDVNSTFALFFEERRPFFQEGSDLFDTEIQTVYTRSINDPILAGKLTGRIGATNVAYIGARDNTSPLLLPFEEESQLLSAGKSVSNILRLQHNFANNSYFGALVTDRRLDIGGAGSTAGIDGALRFWSKYILTAQFVASRSAEPVDEALSEGLPDITFGKESYTAALDGESFWGHALAAELDREGRYWGFEVGYHDSSPTFRADNGFVRQNSSRRFFLWQGATLYPSRTIPFIDRLRPNIAVGRRWNFDGVQKSDFVSPGLQMQMKRQTNVRMRYTFERERFANVDFEGLREFSLGVFSNFSEPVQFGVTFETGRDIARFLDEPEIGKSLDFSVSGSLRPNQHIVLQPRFVYSQLTDRETGEEFFSGYIARVRMRYQFSRRFFMRTVVQYNDFNKTLEIDPLITYKINAFTAIHAGSTHDMDQFDHRDDASKYFRQSSRQIFFKFQYLLRT